MSNITWANKNTGDAVSAADMNEIKTATNSKTTNITDADSAALMDSKDAAVLTAAATAAASANKAASTITGTKTAAFISDFNAATIAAIPAYSFPESAYTITDVTIGGVAAKQIIPLPADQILSDIPTVTTGTTATITASVYQSDGNEILYKGAKVTTASGITSPNSVTTGTESVQISFILDGEACEIKEKGSGSYWRILVEDKPLTDTFSLISANDNSDHYHKILFTGNGRRKITLEVVGDFKLVSVAVDNNDVIYRPIAKKQPKVIFFGDSYTEPKYFSTRLNTYAYYIGKLLNWNVQQSGISGTGYLAAPGGTVKLRDRVQTDVIDQSPDIVVIPAGVNDSSSTANAIQTEAELLYTQILTALPNVKLLIVGPWQYTGDFEVAPTARTGITAATTTKSLTYISTNGFISGYPFTPTGNSAKYIVFNDIHPQIPAGHVYLADRIASEIMRLRPELHGDMFFSSATEIVVDPPSSDDVLMVFDGNSILANDTNGVSPQSMGGTDVPARISQSLGTTDKVYYNFAVSGLTTAQLASDASTQIDVLFNATTYGKNIIAVWEITNHLTNASATADQAFTAYKNYCLARKAIGWKVLAFTVLPRTASLGSYTAETFETARLYINDKIRSEWTDFADTLVDTGAMVIELGDGIHPTSNGRATVTAATLPALNYLIGGGTGSYIAAQPVVVYDDNDNKISASHPLGNSAIGVSINNGSYATYSGEIIFGDVALAAGYYKFKTLSATHRLESAVVSSPSFSAGAATETEFATAFTPSTLRNDFTAGLGLKFVNGASPRTVTKLGRWVISGNSGTHVLRITNSAGTTLGSVTLDTTGKTAAAFSYLDITPVVMSANGTYYFFSDELSGGDQWYDTAEMTYQAIGNIPGAAYILGSTITDVIGTAETYVGVSFKYT